MANQVPFDSRLDAQAAESFAGKLANPAGAYTGFQTWLTLALLAFTSLFNYMDRMLLAVVSQPIKEEFGLSDTQLGLLTGGAFALFYAAMGIPLGRLADKTSRKHVLAGCLTIWSVMTALTGFATSFLHLILARIFVAVGEAGCNPAGYSLLSDNFEPRRRNLALALFMSGSMLGVIAGFSLGGWISENYGWRAAFVWLGTPGLVLALLILLMLREPERGRFDGPKVAMSGTFWDAVRLLLKNRAFVFLLVAAGSNGVSFFGMSQWLPQFFIRSHDITLTQVGWIFGTAFGLGMFVGTLVGGGVATALGRKSNAAPIFFCGALMLSIIPLYIAALTVQSVAVAVVCTFLAAMLYAAQTGPTTAGSQNFVPANVRALAGSFMLLSVALIGIGFGPLVVGMVSDYLAPSLGDDGLRYALIGVQIFNLISGLAYFASARAVPKA